MEPPRSKCCDCKSRLVKRTWGDAAVNGERAVYSADIVCCRLSSVMLRLFVTADITLRQEVAYLSGYSLLV